MSKKARHEVVGERSVDGEGDGRRKERWGCKINGRKDEGRGTEGWGFGEDALTVDRESLYIVYT